MNVYDDLKPEQRHFIRKAVLNDLGKELKRLNPTKPGAEEPQVLEQCARLIILLRELASSRIDHTTADLYLDKKPD